MPPSLMLPKAVTDLRAARTGGTVALAWTNPTETTDLVTLKKPQRARVCRAISGGICAVVGELSVQPGKPANYDDVLPRDMQEGTPRLLRYEVRLLNHSGRNAGPSGPAFSAAGWAPPSVTAATAEMAADGILVHWTASGPGTWPAPEHLRARLVRTRVLGPKESAKPSEAEVNAGVPQPLVQTLEAPEHAANGTWSPDHTLDADAALNRSYRYEVQLVQRVTLDGHPLTVSGVSQETGVLAAHDTFPPAAPVGLAAVADPQGGTIDLSWTANSERDLAGYFVYRQTPGQGTPALISGAKSLASPDYSDKTAVRGVRYSYFVSAVDANGNQSAKSAESTEGLPQ